jgi:U3 small nucleolar RNA-associated protein 14
VRRHINYYLTSVLLASALLSTGASAEIYKWVDDKGNVHFGDKPRDQAQAESAEPVEIREDYKPVVRSTEDQAELQRQQQIARRRAEADQRARAEAQEEKQKKREEQVARCAYFDEHISRLSSMQVENGRVTRYYIKGEDGKSLSTREQQEVVENLEKEKSAEDC